MDIESLILGIAVALAVLATLYSIVHVWAKSAGVIRDLRCPACTTAHKVVVETGNFSCTKCGTPILENGEFVKRGVN